MAEQGAGMETYWVARSVENRLEAGSGVECDPISRSMVCMYSLRQRALKPAAGWPGWYLSGHTTLMLKSDIGTGQTEVLQGAAYRFSLCSSPPWSK